MESCGEGEGGQESVRPSPLCWKSDDFLSFFTRKGKRKEKRRCWAADIAGRLFRERKRYTQQKVLKGGKKIPIKSDKEEGEIREKW